MSNTFFYKSPLGGTL